MKIKVNNVSENAHNYPWMVIRLVDGDWWYYGVWNNVNTAAQVAAEVRGAVVPSNVVEGV